MRSLVLQRGLSFRTNLSSRGQLSQAPCSAAAVSIVVVVWLLCIVDYRLTMRGMCWPRHCISELYQPWSGELIPYSNPLHRCLVLWALPPMLQEEAWYLLPIRDCIMVVYLRSHPHLLHIKILHMWVIICGIQYEMFWWGRVIQCHDAIVLVIWSLLM